MAESQGNIFVRLVRGLWRALTFVQVLLFNLAFLAATFFVLVLIVAMAAGSAPQVPAKAALYLAPQGLLVEQLSGDPVDRALAELVGEAEPETLVRDLLRAIEEATADDRIAAIHLDLDSFGGGGPSTLHRVTAALREFRAAGKTVVASASALGNGSYLLATAADEILLDPMGLLITDGYSMYHPYYRDGLDRLGVQVNVFRVGEYKSAVEPYLRDDMSPEAREANLEWMGDLWSAWLDEVATARGLDRTELSNLVDSIDETVSASGGDLTKMAVERGLVDRLAYPDEVRARLIELVGTADDDEAAYSQIAFEDYLDALGEPDSAEAVVGIVVASGVILDGDHPPGTVGGDSTSALIRAAREDDAVKAVVLRVDSPGGSVSASERIRREVELLRASGKPVVVSMGDVAASGGYWIATSSDAIVASPTTITGSIGIFGVFPTIEKPLAELLGVHVDGVGTTPWAGSLRLDRALDPRVGAMIQSMIDKGYRDFLERVARSRARSVEEIDQIARGRVWSGQDALGLGLVDRLGGLDEALQLAAETAGLGTSWSPRYVESELGLREQLLVDLMRDARLFSFARRTSTPSGRLLAMARHELDLLLGAGRVQAHCFCALELP